MAVEMGVPFLGSVPVDVKFGQLVEGRHGGLSNLGETGDEDGERNGVEAEAETETAGNGEQNEDQRLLVEKYKDCFSYPRFEGFARSLISTIEGNRPSGR